MPVTIELSTEAERTFRSAWGNLLEVKAFEALVIQGYRDKVLSIGRIAELLNLDTSIQADQWLSDRRVERNMDESDLMDDVSVDRLRSIQSSNAKSGSRP